ncbi:hypothetical protein RHGRI_034267 [Rhododendron griersonianum]|uniref:Protein SIEVE ELEMENT OCCLUSION C n=1 Tax=Rhododendron griersonianum TaxID=479676 RepID=A0AAV6I340_9ERIC|nr:hypothetical protein RHGRI_034267 [Rhododendron griersonianum]
MHFLGSEKSSSSSEEEDFLIKQIALTHNPNKAKEQGSAKSSSSLEEDDFLIKQIALTHDPDGRHIDTELLLHAMETVMSYTTISQILCKCFVGGNTHETTMRLLEMLEHYKWDAKAVLVLSAFATSYGEFWLIMQLYLSNPLAASVALLKQLPNDSRHLNSEISASWELSSLVYKLSNISSRLKRQVDLCYQLIETKMHKKLLNLFKEPHIDNQEVLDMLFASIDNFPLTDCSTKAKIGLSDLKNKVVILLVSNPELLPIEVLLLLVQQMHDHPQRLTLEGRYEVLWIPIPTFDTWTYTEEQIYEFLSKSLPWYTIRQPRSLHPIVVKFIQQEWNFKQDPIMVVLDSQGKITNSNAFDMAMVWGAMAYPFSISRENELWGEETWNFQLLLDRIDPLVAKWVEEDQNLCVYGSNNIDWTKEFTDKIRDIINSGLQLKMVYVGNKIPSEQIRSIVATIRDEKLTGSLTFTKINFFWHRLDRMRRSKLRLGCTDDKDQILKQLLELMDTGENEKGWVLIGRGSSADMVRLQGREVMECLDLFPEWGENVAVLGLAGAIRTAIEPKPLVAEPCHHSDIIPFVDGLKETVTCAKCKRTLEKFVVYECNVVE